MAFDSGKKNKSFLHLKLNQSELQKFAKKLFH